MPLVGARKPGLATRYRECGERLRQPYRHESLQNRVIDGAPRRLLVLQEFFAADHHGRETIQHDFETILSRFVELDTID